MYDVSLISDSGKSILVNDRDNAGDTSEIGGKVSAGESRDFTVPFPLPHGIEPGHYRLMAKQQVFIFRKPNRQDPQKEELLSNPLDVEVK
jgi:hypothetical protein